ALLDESVRAADCDVGAVGIAEDAGAAQRDRIETARLLLGRLQGCERDGHATPRPWGPRLLLRYDTRAGRGLRRRLDWLARDGREYRPAHCYRCVEPVGVLGHGAGLRPRRGKLRHGSRATVRPAGAARGPVAAARR